MGFFQRQKAVKPLQTKEMFCSSRWTAKKSVQMTRMHSKVHFGLDNAMMSNLPFLPSMKQPNGREATHRNGHSTLTQRVIVKIHCFGTAMLRIKALIFLICRRREQMM